MTLAELQARIAKHAWEDPAFEAEFMADPKATFEKFTEQTLPENLRIHAHYNTPNELHFVIPQKPSGTDELTDDDLERVAGGELMVVLVSVSLFTSLVISVHETVMEGNW